MANLDGTWTCGAGLVELGTFLTFAEAMVQASAIAARLSPVTVAVHHLDGSVEHFAPINT